MRARRIGMVALVLAVIALVVSIAWLELRGGHSSSAARAQALRGLGIALISFGVLMVSFVAIVLAVALKNTVVQRIGTAVAVIATISGAAALLGA